jgi:ABC-type molybdenum transport system ATPase subunit/photorepair protein PhrA
MVRRKVLDRLSWTLRRGEHWLIRGPNGSGKTTFLELITGDNPQVYRNDVRLFGIRRGSGETIWEIKEKLGIVSYRLHTEYRALGEYSLETVLLSGLHDSIDSISNAAKRAASRGSVARARGVFGKNAFPSANFLTGSSAPF